MRRYDSSTAIYDSFTTAASIPDNGQIIEGRPVKKMIAGILGLIGLLVAGVAWYLFPSANKVLSYIESHPDSVSLYMRVNEEAVVAHNKDTMTPLASVVKVIVAIEYAEQAAAGEIDPDAMVPLSELEKFYVPKTDGGAHTAFLKNYSRQVSAGEISLRRVAKGMIAFSSNANTEYLMQVLGVDRINKRLQQLGVKDHSAIFPLVSSLFVADEMIADTGDKSSVPGRMRELSDTEYLEYVERARQKLITDPDYRDSLTNIGMPIQKVFTERLPASTASEYVSIARKMNTRQYFSPQVQSYLSEVMETLMENPANREWLVHSGQKGGSTAALLTKVLYATLKDGDAIELAYFLTDLNIYKMTRLSMSLNAFELEILRGNVFRTRVINRIELL